MLFIYLILKTKFNLAFFPHIGYDCSLVSEAGRTSFKVCKRIYDRVGVIGWIGAENYSVLSSKSKCLKYIYFFVCNINKLCFLNKNGTCA